MVCTTLIDFLYLKENNNSSIEYNFHENSLSYHHGQHDMSLVMYDPTDTTKLAKVDYSIFGNVIHIKYIETFFKGKGYGKILMDKMAKEYGYHNIDWGMVTTNGDILKKSMDAYYGTREKYLESLCDHIPIGDIGKVKNPIVRKFMMDVISSGYEKAWKKWISTIMNNKSISDFDFNDISEICEWIKGSITNGHSFTENVPIQIKEEFAKLV